MDETNPAARLDAVVESLEVYLAGMSGGPKAAIH